MTQKDNSVNVRVQESVKREIQKKVDSGDYKSITDFVEDAIKEKLAKQEPTMKEQLIELLNDPEVKGLLNRVQKQ